MLTPQTIELLEAIGSGKQMQVNGSTGWTNCNTATALHIIASDQPNLIRATPDQANHHRDVLRWQRIALAAEVATSEMRNRFLDANYKCLKLVRDLDEARLNLDACKKSTQQAKQEALRVNDDRNELQRAVDFDNKNLRVALNRSQIEVSTLRKALGQSTAACEALQSSHVL